MGGGGDYLLLNMVEEERKISKTPRAQHEE